VQAEKLNVLVRARRTNGHRSFLFLTAFSLGTKIECKTSRILLIRRDSPDDVQYSTIVTPFAYAEVNGSTENF
jgi:hypothetical protein